MSQNQQKKLLNKNRKNKLAKFENNRTVKYRDKKVVIVTKKELEDTQKIIHGELDGNTVKKITERKKKKKRPSTLRKAINRNRKKRWLAAHPEISIAKTTCLNTNIPLNVAKLLKMEMLVPSIYKDAELSVVEVEKQAKERKKTSDEGKKNAVKKKKKTITQNNDKLINLKKKV